jgi:hypothetical protein
MGTSGQAILGPALIHHATLFSKGNNKMTVKAEPYVHQIDSDAPQPDHGLPQNPNAMTRYPMNVNDWERLASLVVGGTTLFVLSRRLFVYLALAGAGAYLVWRGLTGHCYLYEKANLNTRKLTRDSRPRDDSVRDRAESRSAEERDIVEEASWESFPASDPPAFN